MAEEKMTLIQKVIGIRADFAADKSLKKTGKNAYAGYDYFELEDFIPKAMDLCAKYGVLPLISFTKEEAKMTIFDSSSGDKLEITSPMAEAQLKGCHPIQNMGAAETYSRRYLWFAFLEITEPDPSDRTQGKPDGYQPRPAAQRPTVQPQNAPQPDARPAVAPAQPAQGFDPKKVWNEVAMFYGYDNTKPPTDPDNADALAAAHELFDPYAKNVADLTPEKGEAIRQRLRNLSAQKGPEAFSDDASQVMGA